MFTRRRLIKLTGLVGAAFVVKACGTDSEESESSESKGLLGDWFGSSYDEPDPNECDPYYDSYGNCEDDDRSHDYDPPYDYYDPPKDSHSNRHSKLDSDSLPMHGQDDLPKAVDSEKSVKLSKLSFEKLTDYNSQS